MVTWGLKNKKEEQKYGILSRQMWFEGLNRYGSFLCIHNGYRCLGSELTHILCKHTHTHHEHTHKEAKWVQTNADSLSLSVFFQEERRCYHSDTKLGQSSWTESVDGGWGHSKYVTLATTLGEFTCDGNVCFIFTSGNNSAFAKLRFHSYDVSGL